MNNPLFVSTIIPTIGRAAVNRAVESALAQDFSAAAFEVIVVNDSGRRLTPAAWQEDRRVRVIDTQRRERVFARNTGAAVARGLYLHFLDDDDWLLPGAYQSLWTLAQASRAPWLYGASQLVDRDGAPLIQLHHQLEGNCFVQVMAGEWIPLQSSLIASEAFFAAGGFSPQVVGGEDVDLARRILLRGDLQGTEALIACIEMGVEGSSTNYGQALGYNREAREKILAEPGAFSRLLGSAGAAFWRGRIVRLYLTSVFWNLRHRRGLTAASRAIYGIAGLLLSARYLLAPRFWKAVTSRYLSETFNRGWKQAEHTHSLAAEGR